MIALNPQVALLIIVLVLILPVMDFFTWPPFGPQTMRRSSGGKLGIPKFQKPSHFNFGAYFWSPMKFFRDVGWSKKKWELSLGSQVKLSQQDMRCTCNHVQSWVSVPFAGSSSSAVLQSRPGMTFPWIPGQHTSIGWQSTLSEFLPLGLMFSLLA